MSVGTAEKQVQTYLIPGEEDFEEEEFLEATDLRELAAKLINSKAGWLIGASIIFLWKKKGGKTAGVATIGKCQKPTGLLKHFSECDFVIWLASDNCKAAGFQDREIEAAIFHELCHAWKNDEGKPRILPHDFQGFKAEVMEYGFWLPALEELKEAAKQLKLL